MLKECATNQNWCNYANNHDCFHYSDDSKSIDSQKTTAQNAAQKLLG